MVKPNKLTYFFVSFVIAFLVGILAFVIVYNLACVISPPYFIDESTGEKYATMPIGQVLIGTILSIIFGIITLIFSYKRFIKTKS